MTEHAMTALVLRTDATDAQLRDKSPQLTTTFVGFLIFFCKQQRKQNTICENPLANHCNAASKGNSKTDNSVDNAHEPGYSSCDIILLRNAVILDNGFYSPNR
jgi:hypothetical protein